MSGFAPKFWRPGEAISLGVCELAGLIGLFYNKGTEAPESKVRIERPYSAESYADSIAYNPYLSLSIQQQRQRLPVFKVEICPSMHRFTTSSQSVCVFLCLLTL